MSVSKIARLVCEDQEIETSEFRGPRRHRHLVEARMIFAWLARKRGNSLAKIGRYVGGRHHATILHYLKEMRDADKYLPRLHEAAKRIEERLNVMSERTIGDKHYVVLTHDEYTQYQRWLDAR